jgi:hypothetical protein
MTGAAIRSAFQVFWLGVLKKLNLVAVPGKDLVADGKQGQPGIRTLSPVVAGAQRLSTRT